MFQGGGGERAEEGGGGCLKSLDPEHFALEPKTWPRGLSFLEPVRNAGPNKVISTVTVWRGTGAVTRRKCAGSARREDGKGDS